MNSKVYTAGLAVAAVAVWGCVLANVATEPPKPAKAGSALLPDLHCGNRETLAAIQAYHAPGQRLSVLDTVLLTVAAEPGYVIDGWTLPHQIGPRCYVEFQYRARNERNTATWNYDPATGRVEAVGDLATRLSGWMRK